jgi:hypothetical protein
LALPPPPHVCGALHEPQAIVPPQPLGAVPQFCPAGHVVAGVQPHTLALPPPPHVCGALHEPQAIVPPQPSGAVPQFCPTGHVVAGVHGFAQPALALHVQPLGSERHEHIVTSAAQAAGPQVELAPFQLHVGAEQLAAGVGVPARQLGVGVSLQVGEVPAQTLPRQLPEAAVQRGSALHAVPSQIARQWETTQAFLA